MSFDRIYLPIPGPATENNYKVTISHEIELGVGPKVRKVYVYAADAMDATRIAGEHGISASAIKAIRLAPPLDAKVEVDRAPGRSR